MGIASSMSPEQVDALLDSIIEGLIAIDSAGTIILFNKRAAEILQQPVAHALGRPIQDILPLSRLPEVLKMGQDELNQRQNIGSTTIIASRVAVRDRAGIINGAVAIFRDISDVQALAAQVRTLQELRELSEAIIRCSQEAISVADEHGNYVLVNPAYTQLMGLTEEQVLHRPVTVDIAEGESVHLKVLRSRKPVKAARLKVGPLQKDVVVNAAPLIVGGELRGSVGVIHDVSEMRRLSEELASARRALRQLESKHSFEDIVGQCPAISRAKELALRAAKTPVTVLLTGESGTGKEMFAHAIHQASNRSHGPFIRVSCAAVAENLLESALFGYEGGAFTGARAGGQKGYFEEADGGTLFLDEIAEAPLTLQAKLLRALQEREIIRVGSSVPISVDVRLLAATNADLDAMVAKGEFRQDLYYRLSVMPIRVPSLRERKEDIPFLARFLLAKICHHYGRAPMEITPQAIAFLQSYGWKGNVRELENLLGRAVINMQPDDEALEPLHFASMGGQGGPVPQLTIAYAGQTFSEAKAAWEKQVLKEALARSHDNRAAAARSLGITVRNLYYKLNRHGLL